MLRCAPAPLAFASFLAAAFLAQEAAAFTPAGRDGIDSMGVVRVAVPSINLPSTDITAVGPMRLRRGDPYNFGDGRMTVDLDVEEIALSGVTSLGSALIRLIGPAAGGLQQTQAGRNFPAASWFDAQFEVILFTATGSTILYTDPNNLIPMRATINSLPFRDSEYQPPDSFTGVNLVDAAGAVAGTLTHFRLVIGQQPTFSVGPGGPSGLAPGDLLRRPTTPAIRAARLGLTTGNLDALSYGRDFIFRQFSTFPSLIDVRFSVARGSVGRAGTDVAREAAKSPPEAHGDEFRVTPFAGLGGGGNVQVLDENGDSAPGFPLQINDELDALTEHPPSFVDGGGDGIPDRTVYFSLQSGAPELAALSANGATILASVGGAAPTVFLTHTDMGLTATDDIDAICLADSAKNVVFSLAPGSPSLAGRSPADLFMVLGAPSAFFPWATAANLGLANTDNVDALKCHYGEIVKTYEGQVSMDVLRNGTLLKRAVLPCIIELIFASFNGEAGREGSFGRFAFLFSSLSCHGMDDGQPVAFTYRIAPPATLPSGIIFAQQLPDGRLTGNGTGSFFLTPSVTGWGVTGGYGPQPLSFSPTVTNGFPGDLRTFSGTTSGPYNLLQEGGMTTGLAIDKVTLEWDARDPANFTSAGFVDAGGYRPNPSKGSLASLFGVYQTPIEAAGAVPLPRILGDDVRVLFDVEGAVALTEEGGGAQQGALTQVPAPLHFVGPGQINLQIPWEARVVNGNVTARVVIDGVRSGPVQLPVADTSPAVFTLDSGSGRAIAINPDATLAQPTGSFQGSHPAAPGDTLQILVTGLGATNPPGITGANSFDPNGAFVRRDTAQPVKVFMGGAEAVVHFAGLSPQFVGVYQVNATVPAGIAFGNAVTLVLEVGGKQSRGDVTIAVAARP